jgi:hypothetical protein
VLWITVGCATLLAAFLPSHTATGKASPQERQVSRKVPLWKTVVFLAAAIFLGIYVYAHSNETNDLPGVHRTSSIVLLFASGAPQAEVGFALRPRPNSALGTLAGSALELFTIGRGGRHPGPTYLLATNDLAASLQQYSNLTRLTDEQLKRTPFNDPPFGIPKDKTGFGVELNSEHRLSNGVLRTRCARGVVHGSAQGQCAGRCRVGRCCGRDEAGGDGDDVAAQGGAACDGMLPR